MSSPSQCSRCQADLPTGARFCSSCGREVTAFASTVLESTHVEAHEGRYVPLPPMRLAPGTRISGAYVIESVLGEGGMGVVYRALDEVRDRVVAIKCLHMNLTGDAEIRRRFVREAKVLRSWSHPYVVAIHDFVEHEHLLGIVMEYVEGLTLGQHVEKWRGRMPLEEIRILFGGVLEAMDDGHKHGVIHRDLKPENILVARSGGRLVPKIVDFGIAKILEGTTYTVSGAFLGTCRYISPEQVKRPEAADHRSDIYSLGVTLYQLCTGRVPFEDGNHFALMMAHVTEKPVPPSQHRPGLPDALEALVLQALAKDPAARPQSCGEFHERLLEALGSEGHPNDAGDMASRPPLPPAIRDTDGCELLLVPAGPFQMGPGRREVHVDAFYMDRTPVTNRQFRTFLGVTGYRPEDPGASRFLAHWTGGAIPPNLDHHPVVFVSWFDACAYATWAGKRLPSEAEWEKAARGTDGRRYPWGRADPTPSHAHFGGKHRGTAAVGSWPEGSSPYGILDLAGNVWEWCEDVDDPSFYSDGPSHNPKNSRRHARSLFVMRGGSWMYGAQSLRTHARTSFEPHYRFAGGGFRCVRAPR